MKKKQICYSGIGGQAVLEGIMMRNQNTYAVAVRKNNGKIEVKKEILAEKKGKIWRKLPFVRGIFSFVESLSIGMKALNTSADYYAEEEDEPTVADKAGEKVFGEGAEKVLSALTVVFAVLVAVALFMILPYYLGSLLASFVANDSLLALFEGLIRLAVFLLYIVLISAMKDIRRVFQYHGAEHKCINCIEHGRILNVSNVKKSSRFHKRCGTSFLLFVMFVSIILFFFIRVQQPFLRLFLRILLIPVIAGISYELIRLAGKSDALLVRILSAPGMWLQRLTTKEPDEDMIEVAIAAVESVFDWKDYLKKTFDYDVDAYLGLKDYDDEDDEEAEAEASGHDDADEDVDADADDIDDGADADAKTDIEDVADADAGEAGESGDLGETSGVIEEDIEYIEDIEDIEDTQEPDAVETAPEDTDTEGAKE